MAAKRDVFVIMPVSGTSTCTRDEWTEIYDLVFRPAVEACGYTCDRAVPKTGNLIASIIDRLRTARIALADTTDKTPNVFYELGVRHCLSKRTIVVCQRDEDIPSDLRGYWSVRYGVRPGQVAAFKREIGRLISEIEKAPDRSDSPVSDYLERENVSVSAYIQAENIKKLGALYTELSGNAVSLGTLLADERSAQRASFLSAACLGLLLQTMYVDIGPRLLAQAYELMHDIRRVESGERSRDLLVSALACTDRLSEKLLRLRRELMSGEYREPPTVSTMVWRTARDSSASKRCHSTLAGLVNVGHRECVKAAVCRSMPVRPMEWHRLGEEKSDAASSEDTTKRRRKQGGQR